MGDLISRSAVIDALKQTGIIQDNDLGHLVIDEINRIPTVYDVDAVVAELGELQKTNFEAYEVATHIPDKIGYINTSNAYANAINIVKRSGVHDGRTKKGVL